MSHPIRKFMLVLLPLAGIPGIAGCSGDAATLRASLDLLDVTEQPGELAAAPIGGFYEIVRGTGVLYLSRDGTTLIDGDVLSLPQGTNLTERRRGQARRALLASIAPQDRIRVSQPETVRASITVFVDTDCRYCSSLHRSLSELAGHGIAVDYVFYPRSGPDSPAFAAAVSVWCAEAPLPALEAAFAGELEPRRSCANPVQRHYETARALELRGTPAIVLSDGSVLYGALRVEEIAAAAYSARAE